MTAPKIETIKNQTVPVTAKPVIDVAVSPKSEGSSVGPHGAERQGRPDGKLAYETWVEKVGHADMAMPWEKLGVGVQAIWTAVAEACDRQTMAFLASERRRLEAFRASRASPARVAPTGARQKP